ncbi:MAG: hypothetical protein AUH85_00650 [Chloroflexi bacterium 13_1_40CM_4_68_4]|nr:MAG: hypothetical protein AUH85_00650 [Chloroflexi bacterium 13_1_40CM_4_68_4]
MFADTLPSSRIKILFAGFFVLSIVLSGRLAYWQVLHRGDLLAQARAQVVQAEALAARRGAIYDHNGKLLATTVQLESVYAIPQQVPDFADGVCVARCAAAAAALAQALGESAERMRARLESGAEWVFLRRRVPEAMTAKVKALAIPGVGLEPEPKRMYPADTAGASALGFVNDDGTGQAGVEARYDELLRGTPGELVVERDPANRALAVGLRQTTPAVDGADLVLTLDLAMQSAAERELARVVKNEKAASGTIVILDPDTGAIRALASSPGFDPNDIAHADPEAFRNRAASWTYEPGSTMKAITIAAALNEHAVEPSTTYVDKGFAVIGGRVLNNALGKSYGRLDISGILEKSANAGAVFVAQRLGADKLYRYLRDFGFGQATGVDLAAEATGTVRPLAEWYPIDLGTAAFGQGLTVTPLQLAAAYAAIANGGTLYRPYIVQEVHARDGSVQHAQPQAVRRVLSPETAAIVREMLTKVVDRGIAQNARLTSYSVAGKTGTAQIASADGSYLSNEYISSFASLVPARDPRFVCLVVIERPQSRLLGTLSAMSAFTGLAGDLMRYARIEPDRGR